jgi:hypothetical protein
MEGIKTTKELYQFVYDNIDKIGTDYKNGRIHGICDLMGYLLMEGLIDIHNHSLVKNNFLWNKPDEKLHSEFFNHPLFGGRVYWWFNDGSGLDYEERVNFLKYLIDNHIQIN